MLSIGFPGGTYEHLFYVADVEAHGPVMNGDIHVALDRTDFLAVFPLTDAHRARLVGTVRHEAEAARCESLTWEDVSTRVIEWMRIDVERVNWFSTYHVHHRVADRFRSGRVFLLGDAAHVHSPVGGQGMNTGIGDAVNLAWKLAAVLRERAGRSNSRHIRAGANRLCTTAGGDDRSGIYRRDELLGHRAHAAIARRASAVAASVDDTSGPPPCVSNGLQTVINYRGSALSEGRAGRVQGGDRLPWVPLDTSDRGADNFTPLTSLEWQVHVYGTVVPEIRAACTELHLALHEFGWQPSMERAGLRRDALYLLRPDGYVALAAPEQSAPTLTAYLRERAIRFS